VKEIKRDGSARWDPRGDAPRALWPNGEWDWVDAAPPGGEEWRSREHGPATVAPDGAQTWRNRRWYFGDENDLRAVIGNGPWEG
jgi:hypothetical protein